MRGRPLAFSLVARNRTPLAGDQPFDFVAGLVLPGLLKAPSRETERATGSTGASIGLTGWYGWISVIGDYGFWFGYRLVCKLDALSLSLVDFLEQVNQGFG